MMEAGVVVNKQGRPIHWHVPSGRTVVSLPDSRDLWDVIWENRDTILGFAHSHPGSGLPGPSGIDITTFEAVEKALGRKLEWWIISSDAVALCTCSEFGMWRARPALGEFAWLEELRRLSYERREQDGQHCVSG